MLASLTDSININKLQIIVSGMKPDSASQPKSIQPGQYFEERKRGEMNELKGYQIDYAGF